jgi:hypothetical protein
VWTYRYTACDGTTTADWTYTYTVTNDLVLDDPDDLTIASDLTQAAANGLFTGWLNSAMITGGCNPSAISDNNTGAPDVCAGGTVTVQFEVTDNCNTVSIKQTASFTIPPSTLTANPQGGGNVCEGTDVLSGSGSGNFAGGSTSTMEDPTFTVTNFGTINLLYTVTDAAGCIVTGTVTIFSPEDCDFEFTVDDPCVCNDDADVNADNGTFMELVTVTGPSGSVLPSTQSWTTTSIVGGYSASPLNEEMIAGPQGALLVAGQAFQYCDPIMNPGGCVAYNSIQGTVLMAPAGSYFLFFAHVDDQGYSLSVQGPAPNTGDPTIPEVGNTILSITNTCHYPDPSILNMNSIICLNDAPITIQGTPTATGTGMFNGDATFVGGNPPYNYAAVAGLTDNGDGTSTFDPSVAGVGTYTISYTYAGQAATGTSAPGCFQAVEATITVIDEGDASWTQPSPVCTDDTDIDLSALVTGDAGGVFSGTGVVLTAGVYSVDVSAAGVGTHTITYTLGAGTTCGYAIQSHDIEVFGAPNVSVQDVHIMCEINPTGNVSLSGLLTSATTTGGIFTLTAGTTGVLNNNTLTYSAPGCYEFTYTVISAPGLDGVCEASATAFVYVSEKPQPSFDIQNEVCSSAGDPAVTFTPNVSSAVYTGTVVQAWTVTDNVTNATAAINATSGVVTLTAAGSGAVTGTYTVTLTETITNLICNGVGAQDCSAAYNVTVNVQDGTSLNAVFTADNADPCLTTVVNLTPTTVGGVFTGVGVTDNGLGTAATFQAPSCGTFAINYTLTTPAGCTNNYTMNITTDQTDPVFTTAPMNESVECGSTNAASLAAWLIANASAVATDNCGTPTITNELINTISGCGNITTEVYRFTATDVCGNTAVANASFIIGDNTMPMVTAPANLTIPCSDLSTTSSTIGAWLASATAADGCDNSPIITNNYVVSNINLCTNTTTIVTWTATDDCGNTQTATADLIITGDQ